MDERTLTMSFQQWLAGVTERIHQTMHYQFDGKARTYQKSTSLGVMGFLWRV